MTGLEGCFTDVPRGKLALLDGLEGTKNPRVGGSIPPLGTNKAPGIAPVFSRLSSLQYRSPCFGTGRRAHFRRRACRASPPTEIAVLVSMARVQKHTVHRTLLCIARVQPQVLREIATVLSSSGLRAVRPEPPTTRPPAASGRRDLARAVANAYEGAAKSAIAAQAVVRRWQRHRISSRQEKPSAVFVHHHAAVRCARSRQSAPPDGVLSDAGSIPAASTNFRNLVWVGDAPDGTHFWESHATSAPCT